MVHDQSARGTAGLSPRQISILKWLGVALVWVAAPAPQWTMLALIWVYG